MDVMSIVNWMQRDTNSGGTIHKWALTQESLPNGIPFMGGFVELYDGATLPLTVDVQAAETTYNANLLFAQLLNTLASRRYDVCNGGTTVNGMAIQTDETSRADLTAAFIMATANNEYAITWKTPAGFVALTAPQIIAIANAVAAFVQKCFTVEANLVQNVASYSTPAGIKAAFDAAMQA